MPLGMIALATLLLSLAFGPRTALAETSGATPQIEHLQQALDNLEVVEGLIQGKVSDATREQAMVQIAQARAQILTVQAELGQAAAPVGGASVTVTETPGGATTSLQVGAPGASLSINLTVDGDTPAPPPVVVAQAEPPPPPPPVQPAPVEMPPAAFASLRGAIATESFSDGKLAVLNTALADHMLSVQQASQLLPLYDFSSDRVEAAVAIHPRLVDPEGFFQLYAAFDFESDKEEVREKLGL